MAESAASKILTILQSELNGAKTQWEYLEDRITNGYKDAYKLHLGALEEMKNARLLKEQRDARFLGIEMFVFSVLSVGFAGGFIGGVIAPWVRNAEQVGGNAALRQGVQGIAQRTTQQAVLRMVPERPETSSQSGSLYLPASPETFDTYLETKEELDGCFAHVNAHLQKVKDLSNTEQWPAETGQAVLDGFRQNCRLLTDVPDPDMLPARLDVAKAAELAMWVAWANARDDWPEWEEVYEKIDTIDTRPSLYTGRSALSLQGIIGAAMVLKPILSRLNLLGVTAFVQKDTGMYWGHIQDGTAKILDLRKLRMLRLQHMPNLPFAGMKKLDFSWAQTHMQLGGGDYLDGLREIRPFHFKASAP